MQRRDFVRECLALGAVLLVRGDGEATDHDRSPEPHAGDDTAVLAALLSGAAAGDEVRLPARDRDWIVHTPLVLRTAGVTLHGRGATVRQATGGMPGLVLAAPDLRVTDLALVGPGATARDDGAAGILAIGRADAPIVAPRLDHCRVSGWSHGMRLAFAHDAEVLACHAHDLWYAGVMLESCRGVRVAGTTVERVTGHPNAYGIAVTRRGGSTAVHPRSRDVIVSGCTIAGVPHWEGLDAHGAADVLFRDNTVRDVRIGIEFTSSEGLAPLRCRAEGNRVHAGTATPQVGAEVIGMSGAPAVDCAIVDTLLEGFGTAGSPYGAALRVQHARRAVVRRNELVRSIHAGIVLFGEIEDALVEANEIRGLDASGGPFIAAISLPDRGATGRIAGNRIDAGIAAGIRTRARQRVLVAGNVIRTTGRPYHPDASYFVFGPPADGGR